MERVLLLLRENSFLLEYSETCVREPPLRFTLEADVERWLSYKGACHVPL